MSASKGEQLRKLLREEVEAVGTEVIQTGGNVSEDKIEALERLARIVEICETTKPPRPRKRWPVAVILGLTLLIVTGLLSVRVPKTEIELELTLTELEFVLPKPAYASPR